MAHAAKRNRERPIPVMNVTPLVDVVLVLLIIFMVVIPMAETSPHVQLPDIFNPDPETKAKTDPFTLSVTQTGELWFEKKRLGEAQFDATLRQANEKEPARRLVLQADQNSAYREVRRLFRACQGIGFPGISMRVNPLNAEER